MNPITVRSLEKGKEYALSFTRPIYDSTRQRYCPDSDRFLYPRIMEVTYCGQHLGAPRHCYICGRSGKTYYVFLNHDFKEIYLSPHCIRHPSTKLWSPDCPLDVIKNWYARMYEEVSPDDS